jgi:hypothetical protein
MPLMKIRGIFSATIEKLDSLTLFSAEQLDDKP